MAQEMIVKGEAKVYISFAVHRSFRDVVVWEDTA